MDINSFLTKFAGDWFSQRTTYNIQREGVDNGKANLSINILSSNNPEITALIAKGFAWHSHISALRTSWDNSPDWGKPKQEGQSLMLIDTDNNSPRGKIWRLLPSQELLTGEYLLGDDESLTFTIEENSQQVTERIWFGNDNLRFRSTVITSDNNILQTCFYSEIRRITG